VKDIDNSSGEPGTHGVLRIHLIPYVPKPIWHVTIKREHMFPIPLRTLRIWVIFKRIQRLPVRYLELVQCHIRLGDDVVDIVVLHNAEL
jgi:hypothetical protein